MNRIAGLAVATLFCWAAGAQAQEPLSLDELVKAFGWDFETGEIKVEQLGEGFYALFGIGGNILVSQIDGDTLHVRQDLRDTEGWWFWWHFRVHGAAGRTIRVQFADPSPIGPLGPAYSTDAGEQQGVRLATTFEIPYAQAAGEVVSAQSARLFGRDLARGLAAYLRQAEQSR